MWAVWQNGREGVVLHFGLVDGLFVDFWSSVSTWLRIGVLKAEDVAVVGVAWPLPSVLVL